MDIKFYLEKIKNCKFIDDCEKIAVENHVKNGGQLRFLELYKDSDFVVYCITENEVIAYAYLSRNFILHNDLYIEQIAVANGYKFMGIGSKLINYICCNLKGYNFLTSNVKPDNYASLNFHKKNGFEIIGQNEYGLSLSKKL